MPEERGAIAMVASEQALPAFQQAAAGKMPCRARFYVEMKPGETTFVSWKKLIKDFHRTPPPSLDPPLGAHPALQARIAPEVASQKEPLPPPPNRFNSVIEKIERIYKGDDSTDENDTLNDFPDDDQYDTEDSFIDDRELNEYFSVDKAKLKHEGFFVNRGKLEWETEAAAPPVSAPKKRKRREIKKLSLEADEDVSKKQANTAVRLKAAARNSPLSTVGPSDSSDKEVFTLPAPSKQITQKGRKDARDSVPRHEAGRATERSIIEHGHVDTGVYGGGVSQSSKDAAKERTDHRQFWKGDVAEKSKEQSSTVNMAEFELPKNFDSNITLKRESEQKEAAVFNPIKVKSAQKSAQDEDSREAMGVAGRLQLGNSLQRLSPPVGKEVSPVRSKGTALERAFQDLERGVAQLCPPSLVVREPEQGKRNRLPQDIKLKLAKVARLAQAKQGRLTDELIDRLMGILGHVMRVKTLKRNLKEMIEMGLSAMQEKEGRLHDIKREVTEMVKSRVHSLQAQDVEQREFSSDDFQPLGGSAEKPSSEGRYQWDHATEDKICDLYEQYIEGMDEHKGPQIRKLYGELAELWPDGWMDNNGIKHAVQRAKERKKKQNKASNARAELRKKQRSSVKQEELDTEKFPLLDLNLPGTDQSSYEKARSSIVPQPELGLNFGSEVPSSSGVKNHHLLKKSLGKGFGSVEKKRSKMEGNPLLKKKVKRKLEKGGMDATVLSSHGKLMTFENPFWKMGLQPLVALPARPLQQRHFLQQSEASAAEHIN